MSDKEKLEMILTALALVAISTEDRLTAMYCAKILEEVGEFGRIENMNIPDVGEKN